MRFGTETWENNPVRYYLLNDFYNAAFSATDKAAIVNGDSTQDLVSLLGSSEYNEYENIIEAHICSHTSYASKRGIRMGRNYCWWGTKIQLKNRNYAYVVETIVYAYVDSKGEGGSSSDTVGLRPTIWIDITKLQ